MLQYVLTDDAHPTTRKNQNRVQGTPAEHRLYRRILFYLATPFAGTTWRPPAVSFIADSMAAILFRV